MKAGGNMVIGGGEFAASAYSNDVDSCTGTGENLYLGADSVTRIYSNGNTIANRKTWTFGSDGSTTLPEALSLANGGTGATSRLAAAKVLTNENVGSSPAYFITMTSSWGKFGYSSVADAKTALGLGGIQTRPNYTYSTTDLTAGTSALDTGKLYFVY